MAGDFGGLDIVVMEKGEKWRVLLIFLHNVFNSVRVLHVAYGILLRFDMLDPSSLCH